MAYEVVSYKGEETELAYYTRDVLQPFERACDEVIVEASGLEKEARSRKAARQAVQSLQDVRRSVWARAHSQMLHVFGRTLYVVFGEVGTALHNRGLAKAESTNSSLADHLDSSGVAELNQDSVQLAELPDDSAASGPASGPTEYRLRL